MSEKDDVMQVKADDLGAREVTVVEAPAADHEGEHTQMVDSARLGEKRAAVGGRTRETARLPKQVERLDIMRHLLRLNDGRDKSLKIVQYFTKLVLCFLLDRPYPVAFYSAVLSTVGLVTGSRSSSLQVHLHLRAALQPSLNRLKNTFSDTRKLIRLAHWLEPVEEIRAYRTLLLSGRPRSKVGMDSVLERLSFVNAIMSVVNDVADDIYILAKLGILGTRQALRPFSAEMPDANPAGLGTSGKGFQPATPAKTGPRWHESRQLEHRSEVVANVFWFATTLLDLHQNAWQRLRTSSELATARQRSPDEMTLSVLQVEDDLTYERDLERQLYWLKATAIKLGCDLVFCSYDVFGWQARAKEVQAVTGFVAGCISFAKIFDKTKSGLS